MNLLYTLSIHLYHFAIRLASPFFSKAALWLKGRRDLFARLEKALDVLRSEHPGASLTWFHCASLGEFEQGRPLIEAIRRQHPEKKILLTFFSPSGYEIRKNYPGADLVFYLPLDTRGNAERFLDLVQPSSAFFVKYEFWFNFLSGMERRSIPVYLVSGIFRDDHYFFKPWGGWARKQLKSFRHFFLQDTHSCELLNSIGYMNTTLSGDTRFDRVAEIAGNAKELPLISAFAARRSVFIAGSAWPEDEAIIPPHSFGMKLIVAPHELGEKHLQHIEARFSERNCLRYSKANESNIPGAEVLIIDNIGMLSSLYKYGRIAFIGGGFGKGIHNILEAATFGLPVIFGPNYSKFAEAKELIRLGGAFSVNDQAELEKTMSLLSDEMVWQSASHIAANYVARKKGATDIILRTISL